MTAQRAASPRSFRLAWILLAGFLATAMLIMSAARDSITTAEAEPG